MDRVSEEIARSSYLPTLMQPNKDVYKKAILSYNYTEDWKKNIHPEILKKFKTYKRSIEKKLMMKINNLKEYELFRIYRYRNLSIKIEKYRYQQLANRHKNKKIKNANNKKSKESKSFFKIENFLNHRTNAKGNPEAILVKWEKYSSSHNSWEPVEHLRKYVPELVDDYLKDIE